MTTSPTFARRAFAIHHPSKSAADYRFRFTTSCSISSLFVITGLFAWKPRRATIMLVNSCARFSFDISRAAAGVA
jgi:hypothetical protein